MDPSALVCDVQTPKGEKEKCCCGETESHSEESGGKSEKLVQRGQIGEFLDSYVKSLIFVVSTVWRYREQGILAIVRLVSVETTFFEKKTKKKKQQHLFFRPQRSAKPDGEGA